jgi:twinkle protein
MQKKESEFISHAPCERCGSSDANAIYSDGHTYCFSCEALASELDGEIPARSKVQTKGRERPQDLLTGKVQAIPNRGLTEETCRLYRYEIGTYNNKPCHIANYTDAFGNVVAQKIRSAGKDFKFIGDTKAAGLFGQHLWKPSAVNRLVIVEGEIDCLSMSQALGNKWPVVSLPNGAAGAAKSIQKAYDYVTSFPEVILMFDQDDAGRKATQEVAAMLPPGIVRIASLPAKDANECLTKGMTKELVSAYFNAVVYRPDGIVAAEDLRDEFLKEDPTGTAYPFGNLTSLTKGMHHGSMVLITSGSGMGKSTLVREIAYDLAMNHKEKVGMLMLEESVKRTMRSLVALHLSKNIVVDPTLASQEEMLGAFDEVFSDGRIRLYDHFGSTTLDNILQRIRYLAKAEDCKYIILDHISILVSGMSSQEAAGEGSERRMIDVAVTKLRTLVQELNICLLMVSHLRRPQGDKGHEDGAKISLNQLRGSHSLVQLADTCIALQKVEDTNDAIEIRVLKNRLTGETGSAGTLIYNRDTGRLTESVF